MINVIIDCTVRSMYETEPRDAACPRSELQQADAAETRRSVGTWERDKSCRSVENAGSHSKIRYNEREYVKKA